MVNKGKFLKDLLDILSNADTDPERDCAAWQTLSNGSSHILVYDIVKLVSLMSTDKRQWIEQMGSTAY